MSNKIAKLADIRVKPGSWGEPKKKATIMLTQTSLNLVDDIADEMGLTRSEILERVVRTCSFDREMLLKAQKN